MKNYIKLLITSILICSFLLVGCTTASSVGGNVTTESNTTSSNATTEDSTTEAPTTEQPTTQAPTTEEATTEEPTTVKPTEPPTTIPPATDAPTTEPSGTVDSTGFGSLYTKAELEAMNNDFISYGPGTGKTENNRPALSVNNQEKYGSYDAYFIMPNENYVYLTFDLGYEYNDNTNKILDVLKEKNVKAVFFPTLSYVKRNPQTIQRIINEGHELGNHSVNHYSMPTVSVDVMRDEIMGLHDYVYEHYGVKMHLFRPPEGACSYRSLALTQSLGYKTVIWSFAYRDWLTAEQPEYNTALETVTNALHPGALYLLHAVSNTNVDILPAFIDNTRSQGYEFKLLQ